MDIDNPVLQSVAAFILKGEDYDSLKSYLETNAVTQYQYALALWGGLVGYVSIPRTIFDGLSRDIVVSIYSQVEKLWIGSTCHFLYLQKVHKKFILNQ